MTWISSPVNGYSAQVTDLLIHLPDGHWQHAPKPVQGSILLMQKSNFSKFVLRKQQGRSKMDHEDDSEAKTANTQVLSS